MEPNNIVAVDRATTNVVISLFLLAAAGHSVNVDHEDGCIIDRLPMPISDEIDRQVRSSCSLGVLARTDNPSAGAGTLEQSALYGETVRQEQSLPSVKSVGSRSPRLAEFGPQGEKMTDNIQTSRQNALRRGEPAVLCTFVAVPALWTALVVPMIYCSICVRSLFFALGTAALVGLLAGIVREVVIGREDY